MAKPKLLLDMSVKDVGELRSLLSVVQPEMRVSDANGTLLRVRVYENDGEQFMEVE
jgi:hypothetical protein